MHIKKFTYSIKSAEEIIQAIGGILSKSGVKRDLWDTITKIFTGIRTKNKIPKAMRILNRWLCRNIANARQAFTNDIISAKNLQNDATINFKEDYQTFSKNMKMYNLIITDII